jgi:hypothetical protein
MTYLARDNDMNDAGYCLAKEAEYARKARATNDKALKSAYESAAREYAYRLILVNSKKPTWLGRLSL